jgi:hypothetical protein
MKPKPGVCGICGCAVVRRPGPEQPVGERNGHRYEQGRLTRVRCLDHGGLYFDGTTRDWERPERFPTVPGRE